MTIETQITSSIIGIAGILAIARIGILALAAAYFIFSLIVVRQVNLMTETLVTEVSPILRAFSIIHAGLALGAVILFVGFLLG